MTVPRTLEQITPEWLTATLALGGARVATVEAGPIGAGAGLLGQLARLHLTYEGGFGPATMIVKMPTANAENREIGNLFQFYEREGRFYQGCAGSMRIRVPACYAVILDPEADEHALLLEDLATGATPGDEVAGCSIDEAEAAIRALAAHHAAWWQKPALDALGWMPFVNAPVHQSAQQSYQQAWPLFVELFGGELTPYVRELGERMQEKVIDLLNLFERPPRTMIHGDFRLDNLFFRHSDGAPVAAIDWQISSRGRGMFDVSYFLGGSLEAEVRRAEEERLVRLWHEIATAGSDGSYGFEEAWQDYRTGVLYSNIYTVIGAGSMDAANERGVALQHAWVRRRSAAMEDLDCAGCLPG